MDLLKRGVGTKALFTGIVILLSLGAFAAFALADGGDADQSAALTAPPGGDYQKVSDLVPLPEFIPGMGTLYVQPSTLPVGPFLGYDRDGKLIHVTYMVPLSDLTSLKDFAGLDTIDGAVRVDHVDVTYNPGHPGVAVPHYHITLWTISADEVSRLQ